MTTNIEQSTVDRMVALVYAMTARDITVGQAVAESDEIAALLPPPVDPDLVTAREIVAETMQKRQGMGDAWCNSMGAGQMDTGNMVAIALAALRKAREEEAK